MYGVIYYAIIYYYLFIIGIVKSEKRRLRHAAKAIENWQIQQDRTFEQEDKIN